MKDVLFIGPYRQKDGWGRAAHDYVTALSMTDFNVSAKPLFMAMNIESKISSTVRTVEDNVFKKRPDVVIQNVLPHYMDHQYGCHNIGISYFETRGWRPIGWSRHLNLMDEIWVSSNTEKEILRGENVTVPINVVPMPIDLSWINPDAEPLDIPEIEGCFVFYFIGEMISRKNITALLVAYHREFGRNEPVKLIIKTSRLLKSAEEISIRLQKDIFQIKSDIRIYRQPEQYNSEFIITDFLSLEELNGLHVLGDCIVLPSRGESLSRPIMEAMAAGNDIVVTGNTPMAELVQDCGGFIIDSHLVPVMAKDPPIKQLYTAHETWQEPSIFSLQEQMRAAYNASKDTEAKQKRANLMRAKINNNYSHKVIAKLMQDTICQSLGI